MAGCGGHHFKDEANSLLFWGAGASHKRHACHTRLSNQLSLFAVFTKPLIASLLPPPSARGAKIEAAFAGGCATPPPGTCHRETQRESSLLTTYWSGSTSSCLRCFWWTGLAPWEFEFPFPCSLVSTFLETQYRRNRFHTSHGSGISLRTRMQDSGGTGIHRWSGASSFSSRTTLLPPRLFFLGNVDTFLNPKIRQFHSPWG